MDSLRWKVPSSDEFLTIWRCTEVNPTVLSMLTHAGQISEGQTVNSGMNSGMKRQTPSSSWHEPVHVFSGVETLVPTEHFSAIKKMRCPHRTKKKTRMSDAERKSIAESHAKMNEYMDLHGATMFSQVGMS